LWPGVGQNRRVSLPTAQWPVIESTMASDEEAGVPGLEQQAALEWIAKWDEQQQDHLPDREDRFTALIDAVEAGAGRSDPLAPDLGFGPGSASARLLARAPPPAGGR